MFTAARLAAFSATRNAGTSLTDIKPDAPIDRSGETSLEQPKGNITGGMVDRPDNRRAVLVGTDQTNRQLALEETGGDESFRLHGGLFGGDGRIGGRIAEAGTANTGEQQCKGTVRTINCRAIGRRPFDTASDCRQKCSRQCT
jgi:hypothetical protein